ncbi:endo-1,4-beta-xylanase [Paenibacillus elgii]|uniref:endo-1,4-beta-xylanase n=1 Tax=Paenibacillus elgii TaxID=189691 RepID=UPI000FD68507|nr:endo-1,4-beta-xylanase [Paenibacillus elgii]NEN84743.1 endo-1,4-beta-xylanase [Paenibacillus elgii]
MMTRSKRSFKLGAASLLLLQLQLVSVMPGAASVEAADVPLAPATVDLIRGHDWTRFSGATAAGDEVTVTGIGRAIIPWGNDVSQPTVSNPPINLRGPVLNISGDFSVSFQMASSPGKSAGLQLYGTLPVIQDEWRQEGKAVSVMLKNGKLSAAVYNGSSAVPKKAAFNYTSAGTLDVRLLVKSGKLAFYVNQVKVGEMADPGVFADGKVYFGADADVGSSFTLKSLTAQAEGSASAVTVSDLGIAAVPQSADSLRALARTNAPHLSIGTAAAVIPTMTDSAYRSILGREFSILTPENDMKFQFIHPQRNVYAFAEGDSLVEFAERNGMAVHGHALVWSEANPRWLTQGNYSAAELQAIMEEHVKTVVGRYKGRIKEWDVINEPLKDEKFNVNLGLRDSIWFKAMGEKFLDIALRAAHEADPDAKLYINEYGCEAEDDKADALYTLVQRLQSRGVPLHGIGFQVHEDIGKDSDGTYDPVSASEFKRTVKRFTDLGLEVRVSELDVNMHGKVTDTLRSKQAEYFKSILALTQANNRFTSYAMWGFTDRYSSLQPEGEYNEFGNGLIYDEYYTPKLPYHKIKEALQGP